MNDIMGILTALGADNSRLAKEAILKSNVDNQLLKDVIRLALDPFTQFYIRKIPDYVTVDAKKQDPLHSAILRLRLLSSRTLTGNAGIDHLRLVLSGVSASDAQVIERIIAKDLKCGVSDATVNKISRIHL